MLREQAIDVAVRRVLSDPTDLRHVAATLSMGSWCHHEGFTAISIGKICDEFEYLMTRPTSQRTAEEKI